MTRQNDGRAAARLNTRSSKAMKETASSHSCKRERRDLSLAAVLRHFPRPLRAQTDFVVVSGGGRTTSSRAFLAEAESVTRPGLLFVSMRAAMF